MAYADASCALGVTWAPCECTQMAGDPIVDSPRWKGQNKQRSQHNKIMSLAKKPPTYSKCLLKRNGRKLPTVIGDLGYLCLYAEMLKMVSQQ